MLSLQLLADETPSVSTVPTRFEIFCRNKKVGEIITEIKELDVTLGLTNIVSRNSEKLSKIPLLNIPLRIEKIMHFFTNFNKIFHYQSTFYVKTYILDTQSESLNKKFDLHLQL